MSKTKTTTGLNVILTVLVSPIGLIFSEGTKDKDILINLILYIFLLGIPAIIHAFYLKGLSCCESTLCLLLCFVGVYFVTRNCTKLFICFFLCFFGLLPGVVYAYYEVLVFKEGKKEEKLDLELNNE